MTVTYKARVAPRGPQNSAQLRGYLDRTVMLSHPIARRIARVRLVPTAPAGQPYGPPATARQPLIAGAGAAPNATAGAAPQTQPNVQVPEPATVVGDSGKPYMRLGDNPNGPEQLSVQPPAGDLAHVPLIRARQQAGGLPSAAGGGTAQVGAFNTEQQVLQKRLADEARIRAAAGDTRNKAAAATAQTIQGSNDWKYGALNLAAPAEVDVAEGAAGTPGSSALSRARIRTNQQLATETAGMNSAQGNAQLAIASSAAAEEARQQAEGRMAKSEERQAHADYEAGMRDRGMVQDDNGQWVPASQARLQDAQNRPVQDENGNWTTADALGKREALIRASQGDPKSFANRVKAGIETAKINDEIAKTLDPAEFEADKLDQAINLQKRAAARAGKVVYVDPDTGVRTIMSVHDADVQDHLYNKRLEKEMGDLVGPGVPFENLSPAQLLSALGTLMDEVPLVPAAQEPSAAGGYGFPGATTNQDKIDAARKQKDKVLKQIALVKAALQNKRGQTGSFYSDEEIDLMIRDSLGIDPAELTK